MKKLGPGRCSLQSIQGPCTEFTPHFYVEEENRWYGYTRNGKSNTHIYVSNRIADKPIWFICKTKKSILPFGHKARKHLYAIAKELEEKYNHTFCGIL